MHKTDGTQYIVLILLSFKKVNNLIGNEKYILGIIIIVAPLIIVEYISNVDILK